MELKELKAEGCHIHQDDIPRICASMTINCATLTFGMGMAALGASIPSLASAMNTSETSTGILFTGRGVGIFIGAIISAWLLEREDGYFSKHLICFVSSVLSGIVLAVVPYLLESSRGGLIIISGAFVCEGLFFGAIDSYSAVAIAEMWGQRMQPWMQLKNMMTGVGGIFAPLLIAHHGYATAFFIMAGLAAFGFIGILAENVAVALENDYVPDETDTFSVGEVDRHGEGKVDCYLTGIHSSPTSSGESKASIFDSTEVPIGMIPIKTISPQGVVGQDQNFFPVNGPTASHSLEDGLKPSSGDTAESSAQRSGSCDSNGVSFCAKLQLDRKRAFSPFRLMIPSSEHFSCDDSDMLEIANAAAAAAATAAATDSGTVNAEGGVPNAIVVNRLPSPGSEWSVGHSIPPPPAPSPLKSIARKMLSPASDRLMAQEITNLKNALYVLSNAGLLDDDCDGGSGCGNRKWTELIDEVMECREFGDIPADGIGNPAYELPRLNRTLGYAPSFVADKARSRKAKFGMSLIPTVGQALLVNFVLWQVGLLDSCGGWWSTYIVVNDIQSAHFGMGASKVATFVTTAYYVAQTVGSIASVPASVLLTTTTLMRVYMSFCVLGCIALLLPFSAFYRLVGAASLLGLGLSCMFPLAMGIVNDYGLTMDSRSTVSLVLAACVADAAAPMAVGKFMALLGPKAFFLYIVIAVLVLVASYLVLHLFLLRFVCDGNADIQEAKARARNRAATPIRPYEEMYDSPPSRKSSKSEEVAARMMVEPQLRKHHHHTLAGVHVEGSRGGSYEENFIDSERDSASVDSGGAQSLLSAATTPARALMQRLVPSNSPYAHHRIQSRLRAQSVAGGKASDGRSLVGRPAQSSSLPSYDREPLLRAQMMERYGSISTP